MHYCRSVSEDPNGTLGEPQHHTGRLGAWLWLRHQPDKAAVRWFHECVGAGKRRVRKTTIVALARKLMVDLWQFLTPGEVSQEPSGSSEAHRDLSIASIVRKHDLSTMACYRAIMMESVRRSSDYRCSLAKPHRL